MLVTTPLDVLPSSNDQPRPQATTKQNCMALLLHIVSLVAFASLPALGQAPFGCSYNPSIKQVDCTPDVLGTLYTAIPDSATAEVERLIMTGNDISELYPGNLTYYPALKVLRLDSNLLSEIPAGLAETTSSLEELYLDSNPLKSIVEGAFLNLTNLRILSITSTPLTTLSAEMFLGLPNLEELYLGGGQLSEVPADLFQHISSVQKIDLTGTQLQSIPEGLFDPVTLSSTNITLSDNPWSADCYLEWFGPFLASNPGFPLDRSITLASWPPTAAGIPLDEVPLMDYQCYAPTIVTSPSDDHILTDHEYSLACIVDSAPFPVVIWLKDGQKLNYTDTVSLQMFDASLHFLSTELADAGVYQCLVENVNGSASSLNATLSLTESTCFDKELSSHETDVDCGGIFCPPCNFSQSCLADSDCVGDLVCLYPHQLPSALLYISPAHPLAYICNTPEVPHQLLDIRLQNAFPGDIFAVNFTVRMNISDVEQKLKEILAQQLLVPVETIGQVPGRRFIETVERASSSSQPLVQLWFSLLKTSPGRDRLLEQINTGQLKGTLKIIEDDSFYQVRLNL